MNHLLYIAAIVLFVLAAVFLFFVDDITVKTDLGIISTGLACFAASFLPFERVVTR